MECLRNAYLTCQLVSEVKCDFSLSLSLFLLSFALSLPPLFLGKCCLPAGQVALALQQTQCTAALHVRARRRGPHVHHVKAVGRRGQILTLFGFSKMCVLLWLFCSVVNPLAVCNCRRQCLSTGVLPAVKQKLCVLTTAVGTDASWK